MTSEQQPQILTEKPSTTASDDSIFNDKKEIITGTKPLGEFTSEHQPKKNAPIARPRQLITSVIFNIKNFLNSNMTSVWLSLLMPSISCK
jgi:hypothetical protein